jgi:hypothetical protein
MNDLPSWRQRLHASGLPVRLAAAAVRREISSAGLFDAAWYVAHVPGAATSGLDPLDHYLTIGARAGYSPGPHFDTAWYLRRYNDVAAKQIDPLLHFIRYGRSEGRDPQAPTESLFDHFQNLGTNCEFGLVQRHFNCETLGLFRFASTPLKGLLSVLRADCDPFLPADSLEITVGDRGEYYAVLNPYGFAFHTDVGAASLRLDQVRDHELRRLRFLWRKFTEDLEEGRRIFVFKSGLLMSKARISQLVAALRRHRPNHLLWVTPEEAGRPAGTVEVVAPGLMRGRIDRLHLGPEPCSFDMWKEICRRAHGLWGERAR